ncbi:MAG: lamin tail domain-containing protein [Elusimicrobia bacterium]|nr:lamin tail domain-containing protein [Elusimicrobiota bacterium]
MARRGLWTIALLASPLTAGVLINEVSFDTSPGPDWVELFNASTAPCSIEGWSLDDSDTASGNHVSLSVSTPLPAGAFLVVYIEAVGVDDTDFSDGKGVYHAGTGPTVALAATEDELSLYNTTAPIPVGLVDFVAWVTQPPYGGALDASTAAARGLWPAETAVDLEDVGSNYALGRARDGQDTDTTAEWRAFSRPTPGEPNQPPPSTYSEALRADPRRRAFSPLDGDPFYQTTALFFDAGSSGAVKSLRVFDVSGRSVRRLVEHDRVVDGTDLSGLASGSVVWDGRDDEGTVVPMGLYVAVFEAADPGGSQRRGRAVVAVGRPR